MNTPPYSQRPELEEFARNLPFLFEHRKEVFEHPEFFHAPLPNTVYGLKQATVLGCYLKACEIPNSPFRPTERSCGGKVFIVSYAGSPLSGTISGVKYCETCGDSCLWRFTGSGFGSLTGCLAKAFRESEVPEPIQKMTVHEVICHLRTSFPLPPNSHQPINQDINSKKQK